MFKGFFLKLRESMVSVLPVIAIVFFCFLIGLVELTSIELIVFSVSSVLMILGIALFNLGANLSMTPMGQYMGSGLTKTGNLKLLLSASFFMGLLITVAEPDLSVLANQVSTVMNRTTLILVVGIGVGLFLLFAVLKIVFKQSLSAMLMLFYLLLFSLSTLLIETGKINFIPLSFDSGGVTTGPITVPFIMAFGIGIASTISGSNSNENSFGLIALCSVGPMLAVMTLSLISEGNLTYSLGDYSANSILSNGVAVLLKEKSIEVIKALGLIVLFFIIIQKTVLKLPKERLKPIAAGILYTFAGLVLFLSAVAVGFMPIGFKIGVKLADSSKFVLLVFAFIIGCVVVLAEPAVLVLNKQVEEITGGSVSKKSMLIALSMGVGISILLSVLRIINGFSLIYYLIPGYFISLGLSLFVPKLYTAIAFDSGGVASGPLTSSFILPFAIGVCYVLRGESGILDYAFGVVAMVAMTPLITIQLLGFKAIASRTMRERIVMKRILDSDDEQIIYFA